MRKREKKSERARARMLGMKREKAKNILLSLKPFRASQSPSRSQKLKKVSNKKEQALIRNPEPILSKKIDPTAKMCPC